MVPRTRNKDIARHNRLLNEKKAEGTPIQVCLRQELRRYLDMLEGQEPDDLYRLVMNECEDTLVEYVSSQCNGNKSRAAQWLGISRGKLAKIFARMES